MYDRDENLNLNDRKTGEENTSENCDLEPTQDDRLIATITYHYDKNQVTIVREDEKSTK